VSGAIPAAATQAPVGRGTAAAVWRAGIPWQGAGGRCRPLWVGWVLRRRALASSVQPGRRADGVGAVQIRSRGSTAP
jgi:hypothetical protein